MTVHVFILVAQAPAAQMRTTYSQAGASVVAQLLHGFPV